MLTRISTFLEAKSIAIIYQKLAYDKIRAYFMDHYDLKATWPFINLEQSFCNINILAYVLTKETLYDLCT